MSNFRTNCSCIIPFFVSLNKGSSSLCHIGQGVLLNSFYSMPYAWLFSDCCSSHKHYSSSFLALPSPPPDSEFKSFCLENSLRLSMCFHVIHIILITRVSNYSSVFLKVPSSGSSFIRNLPFESLINITENLVSFNYIHTLGIGPMKGKGGFEFFFSHACLPTSNHFLHPIWS